MAAEAGRNLRIAYDADGAGGSAAVVIAGAQTDSISIANEPIDITDKDDDGIVTLLDDIATQQFSLSVSGVLTNTTLLVLAEDAAASAALHYFSIAVGTLRTYAGDFFISSFEVTGEHNGAITFSATLVSSGAITAS